MMRFPLKWGIYKGLINVTAAPLFNESLRQYVGVELALNHDDLVLQQQLALRDRQ